MALSARPGVRQGVILTCLKQPIIVLAQLSLGKALFVGDVSWLSNMPLNRNAHYENTGYLWFRLNFTPFKTLPRLGPAIAQETGDIY